jgi:hypothetical protein
MANPEYDAYRLADASDRQLAARLAVALSDQLEGFTHRADAVYAWLRARPTVAPHRLIITPGTPQAKLPEGAPVTTPSGSLSITDQQSDSLTVSAVDALGFSTPDAGPFTFSMASGGTSVASVTDNGDGTATITAAAPGSDTVNCADANGVTGSLPVTVEPGPANSLVITPGTPTP